MVYGKLVVTQQQQRPSNIISDAIKEMTTPIYNIQWLRMALAVFFLTLSLELESVNKY